MCIFALLFKFLVRDVTFFKTNQKPYFYTCKNNNKLENKQKFWNLWKEIRFELQIWVFQASLRMKATSEKAKRRLESKKRKVSAFLQVAELNDSEKRRKILEGSQELDQDAEENHDKTKPKAGKLYTWVMCVHRGWQQRLFKKGCFLRGWLFGVYGCFWVPSGKHMRTSTFKCWLRIDTDN